MKVNKLIDALKAYADYGLGDIEVVFRAGNSTTPITDVQGVSRNAQGESDAGRVVLS